ncbi:SixA phosphatase family protein [Coraliomargarita parva]|uniref:SixA phosphatase family protein n=1 Tax=Coraliomargarita parva TaxID=3014050 RepID=UPI0022B51E63|nr:histidine phosphatase family protein [Coraliomargarita parva]
MKVYLLRHAKAVPGFPDASRCLAERGRAQALAMGRFFKGKASFAPRVLWHSPLARAVETAELFLEAWGSAVSETGEMEALEPEMDPQPVIDALERCTSDILIVGHNPNLEILASQLLCEERCRSRICLKTGSMICLEWAPVSNYGQFGPCILRWMMDPRLLA